ncbi:MAG: DUF5915 domain-containing protein [Microthrixaceae bacterium]
MDRLEEMLDLVRDEVNVKSVELTDDLSDVGDFVLRPEAKVLGPRLGAAVQDVLRAARAGEWTRDDDGAVQVAGHRLEPGEFELALQPREGSAAAALPGNSVLVELDVEVTPELEAEGTARDVVRLVQQARKDSGFEVTDRIRCHVASTDQVADALNRHRDWVAEAVLATDLVVTEGVDDDAPARVEGHPVQIEVSLA